MTNFNRSNQAFDSLNGVHRVNDWRECVLDESADIQQVVRLLNDTHFRLVLIVNQAGKLVGTITDGDVRRGLLRGIQLSNKAESVVRRNPLVVPKELSREAVLSLMMANKIQQVPVVDSDYRPIGLHLLADLTGPALRPNAMVIMAGGKGERLRPQTANCPKPLLEVAGKPIIEHIIGRAYNDGFRLFIIAVHYLGHMIEARLGDGREIGVEIFYVREETPLGTAGALSLIQPRPDHPIIVTNGDVISDVGYGNLIDFHVRQRAAATMAVHAYEWQHPYGVVKTAGVDIVGIEEKPIYRSHVNAGVYALEPDTLSTLPAGEPCDMPMLFERLRDQGLRTVAYPMHEPWLDVGRPDDLKIANSRVV